MLGVLLLILKILLYILLLILGLIILLILIVLFSRFTYDIKGNKESRNINYKETNLVVNVSWLLKILKFNLSIKEGQLKYGIKIFFYNIDLSSKKDSKKEDDEDEDKEQENEEEDGKKKKEKKKKKKKKKKPNIVIEHLKDTYFIKRILGTVVALLKIILPSYYVVEGEFGLDDPSITGQILGAVWAVKGATDANVFLEGNFEEKLFCGNVEVSNRFRLWQLLKEVVWIIGYEISLKRKLAMANK